jgi:DnaK suppressor protein
MTTEDKKKIKTKIISDIKALESEIEALQNKNTPIPKDCSLDSLNKHDMAQEQQRNEKIIKESELRLHKLHATLLRIDKDDYGICQECEENIPFQRLMLLPESLYCVSCLSEIHS